MSQENLGPYLRLDRRSADTLTDRTGTDTDEYAVNKRRRILYENHSYGPKTARGNHHLPRRARRVGKTAVSI